MYQLSFTAFNKTESHLNWYQLDVPFINLDKTPELPEEYFREIDFITTIYHNIWLIRLAEKIRPKVFWEENALGLFTEVDKDILHYEILAKNMAIPYLL